MDKTLLPMHTPEKNRGFVVLRDRPYIEMKYWHIAIFATQRDHYAKPEKIGSLLYAFDDEASIRKLKRWQGIMNIRYGSLWTQGHDRLVEKPEAVRHSQERKLKAALTRLHTRYLEVKNRILREAPMFADVEIAKLDEQYEKAKAATTYNYLHNPNYLHKS